MRVMICLLFVGCGLSEDRYNELRSNEECRIFGPACIGDYESVEACLGDSGLVGSPRSTESYQPRQARECIETLRDICPVRAVDYSVPEACLGVYQDGFEDSGQ